MMPTDDQLWRTLKPGDLIRIVHFPYEFSQREYTLHDETRAAYRHLIESYQELCVCRIDEQGYPWVDFTIQPHDGATEYHSLMLNHDGLEIVIQDRS